MRRDRLIQLVCALLGALASVITVIQSKTGVVPCGKVGGGGGDSTHVIVDVVGIFIAEE